MSLPIAVLQFLIYPVLSRGISVELFGIILTIVALKNTLSFSTGNSLNNVRLLRESETSSFKDSIDYNLLLILSQIINLAAAVFLTYFYFDILAINDFVILFFVFSFSSLKIYGSVFYRIKLNFRKIAILSLINMTGAILGLLIHISIYRSWVMIFFISELLSIIYILKTTPILKERSPVSNEFKEIGHNYFHLLSNAFIINMMKYLDRFLINPLIGADQVAVYYVATIISKTVSLAVGPMNSVALSYTAKYKSRISGKIYARYLLMILLSALVQIVIIYFFSEKLISFLYPQLYESSKEYIVPASIGIIIGISSSILHPLIITTSDLKWQPRINIVFSVFFLSSAIFLTRKMGLYGFIYSSIAAQSLKFLMMLYVGYKGINQNLKNRT